MKLVYTTLLLVLCFAYNFALAGDKYWVGPLNGHWSDRANWSDVRDGAGGAALPGSLDNVLFLESGNPRTILILVDISPTIATMNVSAFTTLYAATPITIKVLGSLIVGTFRSLKDSTSADVPFNFILNGATAATGRILGNWIFEGGVPVSRSSGNGATFTAEPGSQVVVGLDAQGFSQAASIECKKNTNYISSNPSTLIFRYYCKYVLEDNLDASIPNATWTSGGSDRTSPGVSAWPVITINGSMNTLKHLSAKPEYRGLIVNIPNQATDASLDLPDGTIIENLLTVVNTNNKTLTLLSSTSPGSSVDVNISGQSVAGVGRYDGKFTLAGNSKVAMSNATREAPATSYHLSVRNFIQSDGNFSLQDYNEATGSSTLTVFSGFAESGGTFITNSASLSPAKFVVEMKGPDVFISRSGSTFDIYSPQSLRVSSGTLDNGNKMVTLKIAQSFPNPTPPFPLDADFVGVNLLTPVTVGRLELLKGTVNTTAANILTVTDPDPITAITVGTTGKSYVFGPMRRATNSTEHYVFPTGAGNRFRDLRLDSCVIIPASSTASVYQAEYFNTAYSDLGASSPLKGVSNAEYWNITKISGADASVSLTANSATPGASASDALVAARYINGHWNSEKGTVLSPGNVTAGSVTSKQLPSFGPFTFGYGDAAVLSQDTIPNVIGGLNYKYYEGFFDKLPDFNALTPVKSGNSPNIDLGIRRSGVNDSFAIVWQGYINIPAAGTYTFETVSDDGSKFYFNSFYSPDGVALVDNDSTHPAKSVSGSVSIPAAGKYPVTITYFENYGGEGMQLFWSGPGIERQLVPNSAFAASAPPGGSGLNYKYYEGGFSTLPDFNTLTPVKTGNSKNIDLGIRRAGVNDSFAIVWEGYINIPTPGVYTFETVSDDGSKLYFNSLYSPNGTALVDNDSTHPAQSATGTINVPSAGKYLIAITYFENYGGEGMQVYWKGPGIPRQLIPDEAFAEGTTPPPPSGLNYKYYEGAFSALPDFNTLTPVKTGNSTNIDLGIRRPGVNDSFAIVWEGFINIPTPGTYRFETVSDDGSKLYFNSLYSPDGIALVDNDGTHPPQSISGTVDVPSAGRYPITITYFENYGSEGLQVYWSGPGISRQLIPDAAFGAATQPENSGLNYKYYEGDFNTLPDFSALTPVKTGSSPNIDITERPAGVNDHFAFVWEGYINIPTAGAYTFETESDDGSKLYFNSFYSPAGTAFVDNDGVHASRLASGAINITAAGKYPITITFFDKDGGEGIKVYWTGPGIERQLIPDAAFAESAAPPANGLDYKYYEGDFNTLPDFSTLTPVKTGKTPNVDLAVRPAGVNDHFAFVWEGYINLPTAGTYTFETLSDDGSKLYFNSLYSPTAEALVNNDGLHAAWPETGTITVAAAGLYPISITYFEKDGGETMQVYWTGPGIERQLIPDEAFSSGTLGFSFTRLSGSGMTGRNEADEIFENGKTGIRKVYPNPFSESFNISFYNASANNKISVGIYDLNGRLLYMYYAGNISAGNNILNINANKIAGMTNGVYFAKLAVNGMPSKTVKIIKAKR